LKNKSQMIDEIVFVKNEMSKNLKEEELKEIDSYFDDLIVEFDPILEMFDKISSNQNFLENIKLAIKDHAKEEKWLEKLSKTFYDQKDIQDLMKTQKE